jgi:hypothetical protein
MPRAKGKRLSAMLNEPRHKGNAVGVNGDPFGKLGNLTPAQRIKRGRRKITEDDPRWRPKR